MPWQSKKMWVSLLVLVLVLGASFFLWKGYRFSTKNGLSAPASITLVVPKQGTTIYLDASKKTVTKKDSETVTFEVSAGKTHSFILSRGDLFYPWKKDVTPSSGESITLSPFLVGKNVGGSIITEADPEYERILQLIDANTLPSKTNAKISSDGKVAIWVEDGAIMATWLDTKTPAPYYLCETKDCSNDSLILTPKSPLRNIDFYKDHSDILIVSFGDSAALLDLNPKGTQNFQPVYTGGTPRFTKNMNGESIFLTDGQNLVEVII